MNTLTESELCVIRTVVAERKTLTTEQAEQLLAHADVIAGLLTSAIGDLDSIWKSAGSAGWIAADKYRCLLGVSLWCEACKSFHPVPRDKEHHAALKCFAKWKEKK